MRLRPRGRKRTGALPVERYQNSARRAACRRTVDRLVSGNRGDRRKNRIAGKGPRRDKLAVTRSGTNRPGAEETNHTGGLALALEPAMHRVMQASALARKAGKQHGPDQGKRQDPQVKEDGLSAVDAVHKNVRFSGRHQVIVANDCQ